MAALMLQGTGSDVGKSVLVAGLCRAFANRGFSVAPFKPQNMSNNAAVTAEGGEIGRAQAVQAAAARMIPTNDMNPVLLKPQSDRTAQLVVNGQVHATLAAGEHQSRKAELIAAVLDAYARLRARAELIITEGAGSPAEINLRRSDIANMGFARAAGVPVVLVGDIDRGGVIASLVGTKAVLDPVDAALVEGFIINKFRGDPSLFDSGYREIERRTGWRGFGIVPWLREAGQLPAEDAVILDRARSARDGMRIAVPMLSRIANFDDFDVLANEPGVDVAMVPPGAPLPGDADLIILPGTKATIADLGFLRAQGWDIDLLAHVRRGGRVLGICGGYQMLGRSIADPHGLEGRPGSAEGLGLLAVHTVLEGGKTLREVQGSLASADVPFAGYEIHVGRTALEPGTAPLLRFSDGSADGAVSGNVAGCYVHGLFDHPAMRSYWLDALNPGSNGEHRADQVDAALEAIAAHLEQALDLDALLRIAEGAT